jgi:hypothetical protein
VVVPFKTDAFHIALPGPSRSSRSWSAPRATRWGRARSYPNGTIDVTVLARVPTTGRKVEDLEERVAEIRRPYLDTLARWPAVA